MVDIQGPGRNPPQDPYENIRIDRVERDKQKEKEEKRKEEIKKLPKAKVIFTHLLLIFEKVLSLFSSQKKKARPTTFQGLITSDLKVIYHALERLKEKDISQNISYLQHLSKTWHKFLESSIEFKRNRQIYLEIEDFIYSLQNYPEDQEHSLGYYLAEYAGSKWLPLPFMDLLKDLHREHQLNPENSALTKWTKKIERLIKDLHEKK